MSQNKLAQSLTVSIFSAILDGINDGDGSWFFAASYSVYITTMPHRPFSRPGLNSALRAMLWALDCR